MQLLGGSRTVAEFAAATVDIPDAYFVQAATPVVHAYGLDRAIAASALAWSTVIAVLAGLVVAVF